MNIKQSRNKRPFSTKVKRNEIVKDKQNLSLRVKKGSNPFFQNDYNAHSREASNLPSIEKNDQSKSVLNESKSNNYNREYFNEEYSNIQNLWNNLGITYRYQALFDNYVQSCTEAQLKNIFLNERDNLQKFGDELLKLNKEINSRENNIHSLRRYIFALINSINYLEDEENEKIKKNRENIIINIISLIKSLRLNSINVVNYFLKVREIASYYNLFEKIDLKLISEEYKYDERYLNKMINDMDFLKDYPQLKQYFDMNNSEIDAFLTNFSPGIRTNANYSKLNYNKVKISVSEELKSHIDKCRYFLLQEFFLNNIGLNPNKNEEVKNYRNLENMNKSFSEISNNNFSKCNTSKKIKNTSPSNSKIIFFKEEDENIKGFKYTFNGFNNIEKKEIKKIISNDRYNNNNNMNENRNFEYLKKNNGYGHKTLFTSNDKNNNILRNKTQFYNINPYSNYIINTICNNGLFRKNTVKNNIIIEREERIEKPIIEFKLNNEFINRNENPLSAENEELNRQLNDVCETNEKLNNEIKELKKYTINLNKKIKQIELENELKCKELYKQNDDLIKEKKKLNLEIQKIKTLMEQNIEKNKQKINDMKSKMQTQKEEYEYIIENKNKDIKELNKLKDKLINEKNEIINQKEQLINERDQLIKDKTNLEEKIKGLEDKIKLDEIELKKYKKLQNDYQNLQNDYQKLQNDYQNLNNKYQNLLKKNNDKENNQIEQLKGDIENLQKEKQNIINDANIKIEELIQQKKQLEQNIFYLNETFQNEQKEKENLIKEKNELLNENQNLKEQITTRDNKINKLNNNITELENKIVELNEEIERLKEIFLDNTSMIVGNYKYNFYKGDLFNFVNTISEVLDLQKIPDFIKNTFDLKKKNIFEEKTYLKGVYPKIITSSLKQSKIITGMCSLYYENYGQENEPLILRIDVLCAVEQDWEEQIENIINYIKEKMIFDEIKCVLCHMPSSEGNGNEIGLNKKVEDLFKNRLKWVWKNDSSLSDGSIVQDVRFIKNGEQNQINSENKNKKILGLNTLSILSLFRGNNNLNEENIEHKNINFGFNKFINLLPIFILLANNSLCRLMFFNGEDAKTYVFEEGDNINQIKQISDIKYDIIKISELKEKINSSPLLKDFDIKDSLFEEIYNKLQGNLTENLLFNYLSMNLNLSTSTNYCLVYDNYYYNRISAKDINILKDPQTKNIFYLVPTKTQSISILLCKVDRKLRKELLYGHKNIYQAFMDYYPKLKSQLYRISSTDLENRELRDSDKTIYIPCFKIDTHLYSYSMKEINKKGSIVEIETGKDGSVGSIEEYFKTSFDVDKDINNSFSIIPAEDNKTDIIISGPFLFVILNQSLPLQLFYVTEEHWIKAEKK